MTEDEVCRNAFAMPINNPAFPPGPYRFVDREYLIISYRTDPALLRQVIPAPLQFLEPIVRFEFINMPDATGFGSYCESGQVIPVSMNGVVGIRFSGADCGNGCGLRGAKRHADRSHAGRLRDTECVVLCTD